MPLFMVLASTANVARLVERKNQSVQPNQGGGEDALGPPPAILDR